VIEVAQIAQRLEELEKRMVAVERGRDEYRALYHETMERCRKLELGLLSSKSGRLPDGAQLSLDGLAMVCWGSGYAPGSTLRWRPDRAAPRASARRLAPATRPSLAPTWVAPGRP